MYTFVNFFSQSFYPTNSTLTLPPSPTTASTLQHECKICKTSFKSQSGLTRHNTIVQKYNTRREGLYELPLEAIKEFKAQLVHIIQAESDANQESLFDQVGNQISKNRLKRFNLPKLTVEWKCKKSREDAKKNRTLAGYISLRFCAQQI
ncbi:unnamed protein product [Rhizophagus irregularis]|nr:unnamed protein product [Rhizophagus irregularis]